MRLAPLLPHLLAGTLALAVLMPLAWAKKPAPYAPSVVASPVAPAWPSPVGQYTIVPSPGVNTSRLVLQPNGRYDWLLTAPNGALESHGLWQVDSRQGLVTLSTDPLPGALPFTLLGTALGDPWPLGEGDLHVRIAHFAASSVDGDQPVSGAHVVCEGLLRTVDAYTDANGWAGCRGTGLPLRRLTVSVAGLPNVGRFEQPRLNSRAWAIGFDAQAARNALIFQQEQWWQQDDGSLMWHPRALPTAPTWTYRHD